VASDVAAALASTAIVFKYKDSTYSNRLIQKAESLYTFARSRRGKAEDSVKSRDGKTPKNHNGYYDELAWGACWLYKATGDDDYLNKCKYYYRKLNGAASRFTWSDKQLGIQLLLSKAGVSDSAASKGSLEDFCDYNKNRRSRTDRDLIFYSGWATNRVTANTVFVCLMFSHLHNDMNYESFGRQQIDRMFGNKDRDQRSYFIGYGFNPPEKPHHRAASCPYSGKCDFRNRDSPDPNPQELVGGLVGGRAELDKEWVDNRRDYRGNEVSMSQAGFHSAVAALLQLQHEGRC